jgi:parallel beta-helix repeat protein
MPCASGFLVAFMVSLLLSIGCSEDGGEGQVFPCTEQGIRDAIAQGGGPHTFACDGPTTVITEDTIQIYRGAAILNGEGNLTIDGNNDHPIFWIFDDVTIELRGIRITKGADICSAISNFGTLTLTDSTVSDNSGGAAICNERTLSMTNSTVSGNSPAGIANTGGGTAILTDSTVSDNHGTGIGNTGTMTLTNVTVSGNNAEDSGGGIGNAGTLTLNNSTVSNNSAGWAGGGIVNSFQGKLTLNNSTVSDNSAVFWGGGIHNAQPTGGIGGTLKLNNSTVSGNTASANEGGGIFTWGGTTTLANSTVSGNSAGAQGSGIVSYQTALTFIHTLVDNDCAGGFSVVSGGSNLESPGDTCGFDQPTDQVNVSAEQLNLGPLQDNGGPTMTHALLPGSVAIDQIPEADCVDADGQPLTTDQRGEPRPETGGTMCDVGAFELQP